MPHWLGFSWRGNCKTTVVCDGMAVWWVIKTFLAMNSGKNRPEGKQGRLITSQAQQEHHCQDMNGQSYQSFLESTLTYKTTPKSPGKRQTNKVSVKFHCLAVKTYTESHFCCYSITTAWVFCLQTNLIPFVLVLLFLALHLKSHGEQVACQLTVVLLRFVPVTFDWDNMILKVYAAPRCVTLQHAFKW